MSGEDITEKTNRGQLPPEITPQPIPLAFSVQPVERINHVAVQLFDVSGQRVFFLTEDACDEMAKQLMDAARELRTGIVVPPAGGGVQTSSGLILP